MEQAGVKELFESIGIKDKSLEAILGNEVITNSLLQILKDNGVSADKGLPRETSTLLVDLATPSVYPQNALKHRDTLAKLVIEGKLKKINMKSALQYVKNLKEGEEFNQAAFEKETGVGVVVTKENVVGHVATILDSKADVLKEKGYNATSEIFALIKKTPELQWADGKLINEVLEEELVKRIGERPQKAAAKPKQATQQTNKTQAPVEEELTPDQYREMRIRTIQQMKIDKKMDPYPHKFNVTIEIGDFRKKYDHLKKTEQLTDVVSVAGRLVFKRIQSTKLFFYRLHGGNSHVQVIANFQFYDDKDDFKNMNELLHRGDIVGVIGYPSRSNSGELSIVPQKLILLSPCMHNLPHPDTLKEQETRYRQRYLDLMVNSEAISAFRMRSRALQFIRNFFDKRGFMEVETPTMNLLAGGATAKPFITYHNDLGMPLFMRVAPELYLKQLIIGGMEKVYEIGKNYRNEGIDLTHNPEFSAIEFYWAYADYEDIMELTEDLLSTMVLELTGSYKIKYHYEGRPQKVAKSSLESQEAGKESDKDAHHAEDSGASEEKFYEIDFTPPYKRVPMVETLEKKLNVKFPKDLASDETTTMLKGLLKTHKLDCTPPLTIPRMLDKLVGEFIECDLINPSFITNHPQIMSPLAKWHRSEPGLTERFELFVAKRELINAYTELNDPAIQRERFQGQTKDRDAGDDEAQPIDESFCTALEYGLPPTGGWGMGIDRLVMFLTNNNNIKEVILFPALKPLDEERAAQIQQLKLAHANTTPGIPPPAGL